MNQLLNRGQVVELLKSGLKCQVQEFLGAGGQGEVYSAKIEGDKTAIKWYYVHSATSEQYDILQNLIKIGPPDKRFLWPVDIAKSDHAKGFGYIMPLRPKQYKSIVDLMKRRAEPTFRALITACFQLCDSFHRLHSKGLCYRDISFGNIFFDQDTGDVMVCDNDNVTIDQGERVGVLGTPRFMAPEIVRGEAKPSSKTDLYSLAVLLFYMMMIHHPLEGKREVQIKCMDLPAMNKLYGTEPLFIFNPKDRSNEPHREYHKNPIVYWGIYPLFIQELFTRAFTRGLTDPENGRIRETEWKRNLIKLRDSIVYCSCGMENFYDSQRLKTGKQQICWSCGREVRLPPRIKIGSELMVLNYDTKIYSHHIDCDRQYDFAAPLAEVIRNPNNPNIWGLKNLSNSKWISIALDGKIHDVESGKSVSLQSGTRINFGKAEGEIRI